MRKAIFLGLIVFTAFFCYRHFCTGPFAGFQLVNEEEENEHPAQEFSAALADEEFLLKDPHTGKVPEGIRELELMQADEILRSQTSNSVGARMLSSIYTYQGPDNLGGRTRAIAFDVSDASSNT